MYTRVEGFTAGACREGFGHSFPPGEYYDKINEAGFAVVVRDRPELGSSGPSAV